LRRGRVQGWLHPFSAEVIAAVSEHQRRAGIHGAVAEIGVHHGKLFILMAQRRGAGEGAIAIDVFEQQHLNADRSGRGDRQIFFENLRRWLPDADQVAILQRSSFDVTPHDILQRCGKLRLASIDGGHTEDCVVNDVNLVQSVLAPRGIVILDDYFNEFWPEVASGVARFVLGPDCRLQPFAITPNKTYFAAPDDAAFYRRLLREHESYYFEKTSRVFGHDVDIYGTQPYSFSLKKRAIEWVKTTPLAPYARRMRKVARRQSA